ncbi:hypothetical protein TNCV_1421931 [Trichonephila clavipes]|nr:hypothetical protein TNCV_1421931 [Trichonephila clavipes]
MSKGIGDGDSDDVVIATEDVDDMPMLGSKINKNLGSVAISTVLISEKTRFYPGICDLDPYARNKLHPGVLPPTMEFNKECSVPVIWPKL